jgi:uncharacterized membrane-anchored protein YitT (DUF2179 family)
MSYSDWLRKKWYLLLICGGLGAGLMSVLLKIFYYPLATYSSFIGGLLGLGLTYLIYLMDRPAE